jgi:hypothetical protein
MSNLPTERVEPSAPFTYCAVDYFGPFSIKEKRSEIKRYGVLFTCMSSRAVHIETANSLDTDSFINALRRLIAVRGVIRQLRCDMGTNFVGAQRELNGDLLKLDEEQVKSYLMKHNCDFIPFKMNVPSASYMGGVWERQIRTARNVLQTLLGKCGAQLDDESLRTLMYEAMAIINSRPITVESIEDPTSIEPLTPNHLLHMKTDIVLPPPGEFQREDIYVRRRWRRVQHMLNEFWKRWQSEYLQERNYRSKWNTTKVDLSKGDVVVIKDDNQPRNRWPLARVVEVLPSADGKIRKVKLRVSSSDTGGRNSVSYLERPIQKLVLICKQEGIPDREPEQEETL